MPALSLPSDDAIRIPTAPTIDRVETPWALAMHELAVRDTTADQLRDLRRSHPNMTLAERVAALTAAR